MCVTCGCSVSEANESSITHFEQGEKKRLASTNSQSHARHVLELDILSKNNRIAAHNKAHFQKTNISAINLMSSPGSGKTTLLESTLAALLPTHACAVIEGDQQTENDAMRIQATGCQVTQVNTGAGCHLEASDIHDALHHMKLKDHSYLFIENVGNLVCPALFELGESAKVVILSVTEGDDKPLKYPHMFQAAQLMLINKIDLLPYVNFDIEACVENAQKVNPAIKALYITATSAAGIAPWLDWLTQQKTGLFTQLSERQDASGI